MNEFQSMIQTTLDRLIADHVTPAAIGAWEDGAPSEELMTAVREVGLHKILRAEDAGGAGVTWNDILPIIKSIGASAIPLPLSDLVAAEWLAEKGGITTEAGSVLLWGAAEPGQDGLAIEVFNDSALATHIVAWDSQLSQLHLVARPPKADDQETNVAGEKISRFDLPTDGIIASGAISTNLTPDGLGAMIRAAQMVGAMEAALKLSVAYANERVQFGRPIGKFQAVQQQLAEMSGHIAAASRATEAAFQYCNKPSGTFDIASAKVMAGRAAEATTSIAHQVHGAIGFTYEYQLQFLTRRLWAWGSEFGSQGWWAEKIGELMLQKEPEDVWAEVTSGNLAL